MAQSGPLDLSRLDPVFHKYTGAPRDQLLPALLEAQSSYGYLPAPAVEALGKAMRIPLAEINGVIEFYTMLYKQPVGRTLVRVCTSPMCAQAGAERALGAVRRHLRLPSSEVSPDGAWMVEEVACLGLCDHAPAALVGERPVAHIDAQPATEWLTTASEAPLGYVSGEPRWLSGRCGGIAPADASAFLSREGGLGLKRALKELAPEQVIAEVKAAGLVGRGGAAFPTAMKWEMTAAAPGAEHLVVCNADESEPGTFKDRLLLEGDPLSVLEGMAIAGYAIGAHRGFLYIRGEYPRAQRIVRSAIEAARAAGLLGDHILGTDFAFDVILRSGAGAYICGEETALFDSIEGKRGYPRLKPPFPTTHGLFGQPTVINNVETLCAAAWIVGHGAAAYRSVGTKDSPGSKLFCLSGDVARPGVYEVPYGTRLRALLEMAGGVRGSLQAILLGGAAGAFASPDQLDLEMSFEGLRAAGLPLGSGVVMAINADRDLRYTLLSLGHFFAHESCGKCLPCQLGTQRQLEILARVAEGAAEDGDMDSLQDIGFTMTNASLCGLGMTAGSAVLSAMEKWPELFDGGR